MNNRKLFIASPISAFDFDAEYIIFRDWIESVTSALQSTGTFTDIFCVANIVKSKSSLDDPIKSLQNDIGELESATDFLLIYPKSMATSALIELGYAMAKKKKILIVHPENVPLPFMASKLNCVFSNISTVSIHAFDHSSIELIVSCYEGKTKVTINSKLLSS